MSGPRGGYRTKRWRCAAAGLILFVRHVEKQLHADDSEQTDRIYEMLLDLPDQDLLKERDQARATLREINKKAPPTIQLRQMAMAKSFEPAFTEAPARAREQDEKESLP